MRARLRRSDPRTAVALAAVTLCVAFGGGAYAAIALPSDSVGKSDGWARPVLRLVGTPVFASKVIPAGGTEVGTRRVFSEDLRDSKTNRPVGQHSGTCTLVREPAWWLCHAGWTLNDVGPGPGRTGTIVAGALFDFAAGEPPYKVAVFGGTGDFDTVRGEIAAAPVGGGADWSYKLELMP